MFFLRFLGGEVKLSPSAGHILTSETMFTSAPSSLQLCNSYSMLRKHAQWTVWPRSNDHAGIHLWRKVACALSEKNLNLKKDISVVKWERWETLSYTNPYIAFVCSAFILLDLNKTVRFGKKVPFMSTVTPHRQLNHGYLNIVTCHRQFCVQLFCDSASVHDICFLCCSWVSRLAHKL